MTAAILVFCLGLGVVGMMLVGRGDEAIQDAQSESEDGTDCGFTTDSEQLMVYQAPVRAQSQKKAVVLGGETYPIINQNNGYYLLQLAGQDSGWVSSEDGTTHGNCDNIPLDGTPLAGFPTVCAFTNSQDVALYSESDLFNAIGTVPPGTYLIESAGSGGYYIVLDEGYSGWVAAADGQIAGACQTLPGIPG